MIDTTTYSQEDIFKLIVNKTGCSEEEITLQSDIFNDLGCSGDDFHELIDEYAKQFNVDMNAYLWYFHTDEEGNNIGGVFFRPPYARVKHIPVTPEVLLKSANKGKWIIKYPVHKLPKRRYDIIFNQVLLVLMVIILIYKCAT